MNKVSWIRGMQWQWLDTFWCCFRSEAAHSGDLCMPMPEPIPIPIPIALLRRSSGELSALLDQSKSPSKSKSVTRSAEAEAPKTH